MIWGDVGCVCVRMVIVDCGVMLMCVCGVFVLGWWEMM